MSIPVIINNCNLLTYPKQMVDSLSRFDNIGDIIIVDNNSTYGPLLEWYDTNPCTVVRTTHSSHLTPWHIDFPKTLKSEYYIVTDPDLDLTITPLDSLNYLLEKIKHHTEYDKIGLSLKNWNVSESSPYHQFLKLWANTAWNPSSMHDGLLTTQQIDTTFAIYNINKDHRGNSCATNSPYSVNHIPWEFTTELINNMKNSNYEYYSYLCNSNGSSSYKTFINFNNTVRTF